MCVLFVCALRRGGAQWPGGRRDVCEAKAVGYGCIVEGVWVGRKREMPT